MILKVLGSEISITSANNVKEENLGEADSPEMIAKKKSAMNNALKIIDNHYKKPENQINSITKKTKEQRANHPGFNSWLSDRGKSNPYKEGTE